MRAMPQSDAGNVLPEREQAFTLIELLVVIAIIGILAAILVPVLNEAELKSKTTICINNMHELGLAVPMYASDNSDEMVFDNWDGAGETVAGFSIAGWLYTHQLVSNGAGAPGAPFPTLFSPGSGPYKNNKTAQASYSTGALWDYVKNIQSYWCPLMYTNAGTVYSQNALVASKGYDALSSYIMNGAVNNYYGMRTPPAVPGPKFYKLSNIAFKATCVLLWEPDENLAGAFNDGAAAPNVTDAGEPSKRHVTGCVFLRIGGSADFMKYQIVTNQMNTSGPNDWWYGPYFTQSGGYPDGQPSHL